MTITIPPIPPFVMDDACMDTDNDGGGEEDDFVAVLKSRLEHDLKVDDFALQFEKQLEQELLSDAPLHNTSLFDLPLPLFDNDDLQLEDLDKDYGTANNQQSKRICGK